MKQRKEFSTIFSPLIAEIARFNGCPNSRIFNALKKNKNSSLDSIKSKRNLRKKKGISASIFQLTHAGNLAVKTLLSHATTARTEGEREKQGSFIFFFSQLLEHLRRRSKDSYYLAPFYWFWTSGMQRKEKRERSVQLRFCYALFRLCFSRETAKELTKIKEEKQAKTEEKSQRKLHEVAGRKKK